MQIIEFLIRDCMLVPLLKHGLINECNRGFSKAPQDINFLDAVMNGLELIKNCINVVVCYIDFAKALSSIIQCGGKFALIIVV